MSSCEILADDLFAGAGGWDIGARHLGINGRGVENMKEARATRAAAGLETIHDDVWTFRPDGRATLQIASPPCPTFSAAGSGSGRRALSSVLQAIADGAYRDLETLRAYPVADDDDRTRLVLTPLHFATQYGYEELAWEQVPPVLPVWEACAEVLRAEGWNVWTGLVYAEEYGVPQTRKRAVLIASRNRGVGRPRPTHSKYYARTPGRLDEGVQKWVSMAEALNFGRADLLASPSGITGPVVRPVASPAATVTGAANAYVFTPEEWARRNPGKSLPTHMGDVYNSKGCVRSVDEPAPTMTGSMDNGNFRWFDESNPPPKVEGRLALRRDDLPEWAHNRPATTIVGSFKPEIVAAPGYRTTTSRQNAPNSVRVTVEEAGVLQSFPADYPWQGAKGKTFLQVGNAVPPLMAMHVLAEALGMECPR